MNRTQIYLDDGLQKELRRLSKQNQSSVSQLIRQAVSEFIVKFKPKSKKDPLLDIVGICNVPSASKTSTEDDVIYE